ncbi:MAG: hypothetical protein ACREXY_01285 [Gammaproteobacteria bacterium]
MTICANLKLHLRRHIFIVTLGLLIAQVGMLGHALEHTIDLAQDRPHAACLLCHAADHLGQGLPSAYALATLPQSPTLAAEEPRIAADIDAVFPFLARAPPAALQV